MNIPFIDLGKMKYQDSYKIQIELAELINNNRSIPGFFLLVEHYPVFTIGVSKKYKDFLLNPEYLKSLGFEIYETNRGGKVTYHGPGQIVGYPIFNLKLFKTSVRKYIYNIEQLIIDTLTSINIDSYRNDGLTGVWVNNKKVCAIGVAFKKNTTMHGFALNYKTNLEHFNYINPCGLSLGVTSIQDINSNIEYTQIINSLTQSFENVFNTRLISTTIEEVRNTYDNKKATLVE
ncbi:Octanoate-[acyl-carrier-protein]-protein-N-octanoyltransferase [Candidatus Syntrophocurvum alkaliphilum]|uniref:Octanoyltransferase n=1 Tax=Candidatus Syntrophocurvum alkaliphilum TaxID=2293317 RepID=A0A6I6DED8_9FIRM|nr:lipoyl(octanoyl) transferase LipB [Candidatus Syntrophocurvum alkaliphilum]QGT99392.1 Octanoate-[acyl-carrier-protein]-protein-N-octanoyltransferase [Candidatus Syntrophocurvum alkaliphilum]